MKGLDVTLAKYAWLDGTRVAAAGASYGGYMIGWMASQSKGRFKTLVCHAGVYDLVSMYGATEEVWFAEASFRGTPWANPDNFLRQSPHTKAADFGTFKTPTLVVHGELDFRVPYHARPGVLHRTAAAGRAVATGRVPRRGALDSETSEQRVLVLRSQAWLKKWL